MQPLKLFSTFLFAILFALLSCVAFAQTKQQDSPLVISAVAPVYTSVVVILGLEGDFQVDVEIDRSGKVVSSKAIKGTPEVFRGFIEAAADRWQFAPDNDSNKRRRVQLTFSFRTTPGASDLDSTTVFYPPYRIEVRDNTEIEP